MKAKAHLFLPLDILEEVDRFAGKRKRSLFIAAATREKLEKDRFLKTLEETKGSWSDRNHPELRMVRDVDHYVRQKRRSYRQRAIGISHK
jgi:hypothetical protein